MGTDHDDTPVRMSRREARAELERMLAAGELEDLAGALFGEPTPYPRHRSVGGHDFLVHEDGRVEDA